MSIEHTIADLAAAIRELAATVKESNNSRASTAEFAEGLARLSMGGNPILTEGVLTNVRGNTIEQVAERFGVDPKDVPEDVPSSTIIKETEKAAQLVASDAKHAIQAALDAAKADAEAKKNAGAAATQTSTDANTAGSATAPAALDYEKDVKPVLVQLAAAKGKPELAKLVKSFGVEKAAELKPEQLVEVLGQARALMAA